MALRNRLSGLSEAPRELPFLLKIYLLFGSPGFLGAFFVLLATVMTVVFWFDEGENRYLGETRLDQGPVSVTSGKITASQKTNVSVGGGKHSKGKPVYAYYFTYQTETGVSYNQRSFSTRVISENDSAVEVEYLKSQPQYARISGLNYAPLSYMGWFPLVFAILGIGLVATAPLYRKKNYMILQNGVLTDGRCMGVNPTGRKIKNRTVYAYNYEYGDLDGNLCYFTVDSTEEKTLNDEICEAVFYLPLQNRALLADKVAVGLTVNQYGGFELSTFVGWGSRITLYSLFAALCATIWLCELSLEIWIL